MNHLAGADAQRRGKLATGRGGRGKSPMKRSKSGSEVEVGEIPTTLPEGGVNIDGAMLEGGGQILRYTSAFSAITGTPIRVAEIRGGRATPGLRPQHVTGLLLVKSLCGGKTGDCRVGSCIITLQPSQLVCGDFVADTGTAGSITLLVQAALPCLLMAAPRLADGPAAPAAATLAPLHLSDKQAMPQDMTAAGPSTSSASAPVPLAELAASFLPTRMSGTATAALLPAVHLPLLPPPPDLATVSTLTLNGGTDTSMAPPVDYLRFVLLPTLRRQLGIEVAATLHTRGFYPRGGGHITITARALLPGTYLPPIRMEDQGPLLSVMLRAFAAGQALAHFDRGRRVAKDIPQRMVNAAKRELRKVLGPDVMMPADVMEEGPTTAVGDGSGLCLVAQTGHGYLLGCAVLGERGVTAEATATGATAQLLEMLQAGACVDTWMQDQLVAFMALADGVSRVRCAEPTLHARTAMVIAEKMTSARFTLTRELHDGSQRWFMECVGAAVPAARVPAALAAMAAAGNSGDSTPG